MEDLNTYNEPVDWQTSLPVKEREAARCDNENILADFQLSGQLLRRYSLDDNGGGYPGL